MAKLKRKPRISGREEAQIAREAMPATAARAASRAAYVRPPPSVQICFRCSPELADRLSDLARSQATTRSFITEQESWQRLQRTPPETENASHVRNPGTE
jgi:hypothetical protein